MESLNREERNALEAAGTQISILPLVPGRSTTKTINKMQAGDNSATNSGLLRLAVLGSGAGSNLRAIIAAIADNKLKACLLYTSPDG